MKITTTKLGEHIAKLLAIKHTVELYEVVKCDNEPSHTYNKYGSSEYFTTTYNTHSYSEYFTTLEEAEEYYEDMVRSLTDYAYYNIMMKNSSATYYDTDCTLRKVRVDLLDEKSKTLDINIEQTIKEIAVTISKYN